MIGNSLCQSCEHGTDIYLKIRLAARFANEFLENQFPKSSPCFSRHGFLFLYDRSLFCCRNKLPIIPQPLPYYSDNYQIESSNLQESTGFRHLVYAICWTYNKCQVLYAKIYNKFGIKYYFFILMRAIFSTSVNHSRIFWISQRSLSLTRRVPSPIALTRLNTLRNRAKV